MDFDAFDGPLPHEVFQNASPQVQQRQQQSQQYNFTQANIPPQVAIPQPIAHHVGIGNIKVHQPKRYDGSRDIITLGNWIFSVERYLHLTKILDEEKVLYVSTLLDGEALLWFRSHYETLDYSSLSWVTIKNELKAYFAPPNLNRRLQDAWASLRQTGSVFEYVSKIQALAMQIDNLTSTQILDKFIRGLKPKTRLEVELRDPQTANEAFRLADRFDRIVYGNFHKETFLPNSNGFNKSEDRRGEPMQLDSLQHKTSFSNRKIFANAFARRKTYQSSQLSDKEYNTLRTSGACFNCKKFGHFSRECPDSRDLKSTNQQKPVKKWQKQSPKSGNGRSRQ